jgi:hypothetical protein
MFENKYCTSMIKIIILYHIRQSINFKITFSKMKLLFSIGILIFLFSINSNAQNDILFLNGEKINVGGYQISQDFNGDSIISFQKKNKIKEILIDDIFSVTDGNNNEIILYKKNIEFGLELEVNEMKSFVIGSNYAIENYKSPVSTLSGFATGITAVVCPFFNQSISVSSFNITLIPALPIANAGGIFLLSKNYPSDEKINQIYPDYANDNHFKEGYRNAAKNKKVKNSIFGSIGGILVGFAILTL